MEYFSEEFFQRILVGSNDEELFTGRNGIRVTRVGRNRCEGELPITSGVLNRRGKPHGGILMSLADHVAGTAAIASSGYMCTTVSATINFLRVPEGNLVTCTAEVERTGGKLITIRVVLRDDRNASIVATSSLIFYKLTPVIPEREPPRGE